MVKHPGENFSAELHRDDMRVRSAGCKMDAVSLLCEIDKHAIASGKDPPRLDADEGSCFLYRMPDTAVRSTAELDFDVLAALAAAEDSPGSYAMEDYGIIVEEIMMERHYAILNIRRLLIAPGIEVVFSECPGLLLFTAAQDSQTALQHVYGYRSFISLDLAVAHHHLQKVKGFSGVPL